MVRAYRVDDRLIHGQVQTQWIAEYQINRIIIIDDGVVKDAIAMQILKIAKPPSIDLVVCGTDRAMQLLEKDSRQSNARTFVIFKTITTAWRLVEAGLKMETLVVGPTSAKQGAKQMGKNTYFDREEQEAAAKLHGREWKSSSGCCQGTQNLPIGPSWKTNNEFRQKKEYEEELWGLHLFRH